MIYSSNFIGFYVIKGFPLTNSSTISVQIPPPLSPTLPSVLRLTASDMADLLHKSLRAMKLDEEEPLTLPDSPRFRVYDENSLSILGRFLNPDC